MGEAGSVAAEPPADGQSDEARRALVSAIAGKGAQAPVRGGVDVLLAVAELYLEALDGNPRARAVVKALRVRGWTAERIVARLIEEGW